MAGKIITKSFERLLDKGKHRGFITYEELGKSLGKLFSYTGLGSVDKIFGFFFGIFKGYIFVICVFSIVNWFYSYEKWDINLNKAYFFPLVENICDTEIP